MDENTKSINDLKGNPRNPRIMSAHDFASLQKSVKELGDLGGIVFNVQTGQLVGGHQRVEAFKKLGGVPVIVERLAEPNSVGTIARGYVLLGDEKFSYREVDWPADREIAANIAANRIDGEWDVDLLAEWDQWLKENNPDLLELTGQRDDEIARLLGTEPEHDNTDEDGRERLSFKFTPDQHTVIERALQTMRAEHTLTNLGNDDLDANALFYICSLYVNSRSDSPTQ